MLHRSMKALDAFFRGIPTRRIRKLVYFLNVIRENCIQFGGFWKTGISEEFLLYSIEADKNNFWVWGWMSLKQIDFLGLLERCLLNFQDLKGPLHSLLYRQLPTINKIFSN